MAKKELSIVDMIESHRPKYFKHAFILNQEYINELQTMGYDLQSLDTIQNQELLDRAMQCEYKEYERTIIGKAKEPTCLDDGIIVSKRMVTKADKKLLSVGIGRFQYHDITYVSIRLKYEQFHIIELFILS